MEATKEIVKMLLEFLERVGGLALSEGFRIAIKFVVSEGIAKIGVGVVVLLLAIVCLIAAIKLIKHSTKENSDSEFSLGAFLTFVFVILFLVSLVFFYNGYMRVSAPEWFAVKNLLNLVK